METCGESCMKYLLFIFNLVFTISGIGLIAAGAVVLGDVGRFSDVVEGRILAPSIVLVIIGIVVFMVAFLGCCGAIRESYCLLVAFGACLIVILIAELAVGIAAAVYKGDFENVMRNTLQESMDKYRISRSHQTTWDTLQTNLECCGLDGPHDWPYSQRPTSCCHTIERGGIELSPPDHFQCINAQVGDDILHSYGCYQKLRMKAESSAKVLTGMGIGIAFIEVVGIIFAFCLASSIKKRESKEEKKEVPS